MDVEGETAYTGYNEVPDVDNATLAYVLSTKNGNVAEIVFIVDGDVYDSASTYFMLSKTTRESLQYDGDYYWEYTNAYVNGVKQSVYVDQDPVSYTHLTTSRWTAESSASSGAWTSSPSWQRHCKKLRRILIFPLTNLQNLIECFLHTE